MGLGQLWWCFRETVTIVYHCHNPLSLVVVASYQAFEHYSAWSKLRRKPWNKDSCGEKLSSGHYRSSHRRCHFLLRPCLFHWPCCTPSVSHDDTYKPSWHSHAGYNAHGFCCSALLQPYQCTAIVGRSHPTQRYHPSLGSTSSDICHNEKNERY